MVLRFQPLWINAKNIITGSYGKIMFSFVRNCQTVSFCILSSNEREFLCSTSLSAFGSVMVPDFGHSTRCVVGVYLLFTEVGQKGTLSAFSDPLDLVFTWAVFTNIPGLACAYKVYIHRPEVASSICVCVF